ncbi:MAG: HlyD family efflux transporter periplasmic adaptor subunit [Sulfurovum sp.]|nr:HlyD family efflux transporter periplasmic adaptor subunit [Sulfurovaceae bacterium]
MKKLLLTVLLLLNILDAKDIYATFNIKAKKSANLAFSTGGIINKVSVDVATKVKKGDILVELKNSDIKAMTEISKTALIYAKKEYYRQLKVKNMIDKSKLDSYEFKYKNSKNQLVYQEALLDKTILRAPFNGVIFENSVEVGDVVSGAMLRTILKIQSGNRQKLIISIDQKYWKSIKIGQSFRYTVDGDRETYVGRISKIYPQANIKNRKIRAEVEVEGFVVGLFGEGYIEVEDKKE